MASLVRSIARRVWPPLLLLLVALPAAAELDEAGYTIDPHVVRGRFRLTIHGTWPSECTPALDRVRLDGQDLRIEARTALRMCAHRPTPFTIDLDPALALGRDALTPGVYRVSFYTTDGAQATPKLRAFALLEHDPTDGAMPAPEAGFWWSSGAEAGVARTVLSLEAQGDQLSVALMSYDRFGLPLWYFGTAPLRGHLAHVPLLVLAGGSEPFSPSAASPHGEPALTLDLQFESGAHALGWLSRERADDGSLQLQGLDLVRLPLADAVDGRAWQGDWVLIADREDAMPLRLRLDRYASNDPSQFTLGGPAGITLTCLLEPTQREWPPSSCLLRAANGTLLGTLDSVGLTRIDGVRGDGVALHLLRVSR
jgi:hypothetical protein